MIFNSPVPQTLYDHLLYYRMIAIQRVTTSTEVIIPASRRQHIINPVIKSFKRKEWSFFISFCRMIKDYIQNHLNAIGIQFPNQRLKFITFPIELFLCRITGVRCKKTHRIISPVIQKHPAVHLAPPHSLIKFKNWHQFHSCNSKFF